MKLVLVIDGAAAVRSRLTALVRTVAPQARVIEAQNGKDGVMLAVMERPDLILLGSDLPLLNGYEAASRLRQMPRTREIPLLAVAGSERRTTVSDGLSSLANGAVTSSTSTPEFRHILLGLAPAARDGGAPQQWRGS
jgi:CheY-like chemotaxis protein